MSEQTVSRPAEIPAPEPDLTAETIIARAKALIPEIRAQADEAEKIGKHVPELDKKFVDAGFYRILQPKRFGGYGTLDEFFEVLTWAQLGIHRKPCGILDVGGYFGPLRAFIDSAVTAGFVHPAHRDMVITDDDPARLLDRLADWTPVTVSKLLDRADR